MREWTSVLWHPWRLIVGWISAVSADRIQFRVMLFVYMQVHSQFTVECQAEILGGGRRFDTVFTDSHLSNKESIPNSVFSHSIQNVHLQINHLHFSEIVFQFDPPHSVSTRSSDSLVLFIPYVRSSNWQKSFLCHWSATLEFTPS